MIDATPSVILKRSAKVKKPAGYSFADEPLIAPEKEVSRLLKLFSEIINEFLSEKARLEDWEKEIVGVKADWQKAQKDHQAALNNQQEDDKLKRDRDEQTYQYETALIHKKAEDEFKARLELWEKELKERKDELAADKEELTVLRKQVEGFEGEKEKVIKEAMAIQLKEISQKQEQERKLLDQGQAADHQVLSLKNDSLSQENARLVKEMEALKKSLEEAQRQLKEIAVKVIEAGGSSFQDHPKA